MTIGERIKQARLRHGLTQEELGYAIGTTKQTINKYENGTITNIPIDKIEGLSIVLDVSESYIMGWEKKDEDDSEYKELQEIKEQMHKNPELKTLFSTAKNAKPEDLRLINDMLKRMMGD